MRRYGVAAVPFALSLLLSGFTVGTTVGWQDSGFFLAGVKDLGVLYPPGFVLYLVLCKAWTLGLGFLDFTLAVHLFSSACAALAAGTIALAARDLLRTEGPLFGLGLGGNDLAALAAGCLAASGYTFWASALLAKGYALLYLLLALLIWRMIRADATGAPRDFTIVAVLIGLAWAAHPSAAAFGPALILFVAASRGRLGGKGIAARSALSAAVAIAPSLLLPVLAARSPALMFGEPDSFREWFRYLIGARFTGSSAHFGVDGFRVAHAGLYLWEDFLGLGLGLAALGLFRIAGSKRTLLVGMLSWILPSALLATLFRIEGQQDLWLVGAWLPLHLAVAVGFATLPARAARWALPTLAAAGLVWSVAANLRSVSMRGYTLAEAYGRFHLEPLDRDAVLLLSSDDALATTLYLQVVKGLRPDVLIVDAPRLASGGALRRLLERDPRLRTPEFPTEWSFAEANSGVRPIYLESAPPPSVGAGIPAGPFLRMGSPEAAPFRSWEIPVTPEEVRARFGRNRGLRLRFLPDRLQVEPEPYEQRWINVIVRARILEAKYWFGQGGEANLRKAVERFEEARRAEPERPDADVIHGLGVAYFLLKDGARAEPLLRQLLGMEATPRQAVRACTFLSTLCRAQGRIPEAQHYQDRAMSIVNANPELRREFERFPRTR